MEAKGSYNKNAAIPAAGGGLALPLLEQAPRSFSRTGGSTQPIKLWRRKSTKCQDHERFNEMKESDQFSDEEKKHLSYLGSMLHQEPSAEDAEFQRILEALEKSKAEGPKAQHKQITEEEASSS
jgi:hypothetical protein